MHIFVGENGHSVIEEQATVDGGREEDEGKSNDQQSGYSERNLDENNFLEEDSSFPTLLGKINKTSYNSFKVAG